MSLPSHSLTEIFGHAPDDDSRHVRMLWDSGICPFLNSKCSKINHQSGVIYGGCTIQSPIYKDVIICPKRLYADNYATLKHIAKDAFGAIPFVFYENFWKNRIQFSNERVVVAIGQGHGAEISVGGRNNKRLMDWVLAVCNKGELEQYTGVEVQSIDITNNYVGNWSFFKNQNYLTDGQIPPASEHGFNWANVMKRLAPQIAAKGILYSQSDFVQRGIYFLLPDAVYKHFEAKLGVMKATTTRDRTTLTVHTYDVGNHVGKGEIRPLQIVRELSVELKDFCEALASGGVLPSAKDLDGKIRSSLGVR
jgi:hypothetical protein